MRCGGGKCLFIGDDYTKANFDPRKFIFGDMAIPEQVSEPINKQKKLHKLL